MCSPEGAAREGAATAPGFDDARADGVYLPGLAGFTCLKLARNNQPFITSNLCVPCGPRWPCCRLLKPVVGKAAVVGCFPPELYSAAALAKCVTACVRASAR